MKQIIHYVTLHWRDNPQLGFISIFIAFLMLSLFFRYGYGMHPSFEGHSYRYFLGFLFYAIPYFFTILLYSCFYHQWAIFAKRGFWITSLFILTVLYANQYLLFYKNLLPRLPFALQHYVYKVCFNLHAVFFYLLIPLLYGWIYQTLKSTSFYGCTIQGFNPKPYSWMLLFMLPLLIWASFQGEFLQAYPRYKPAGAEASLQVSSWVTVSGYEFTYIIQFLALEIFFRGFIVLALGRYMGSGAVFPMVAVYAYLHFFKPMPETIGSVFGGYILGVISFYSTSVLGGMMVHVGVALMMELLAFVQLYRGR